MASFAAYCFASFFFEKITLGLPRGSEFSAMVRVHVKRLRDGLDSLYSGPARFGWACRYSEGPSVS